MRLVCVKDYTEDDEGFIATKMVKNKLDGLTTSKTYYAFAVPICDQVGVFYENATTIEEGDIMFLIYNDHRKWVVYPTECFKPWE